MLTHIREKAGWIVERLQLVRNGGETAEIKASAYELILKAANMSMHEVEYDGGFYNRKYITMFPPVENNASCIGKQVVSYNRNAEAIADAIFEIRLNKMKTVLWASFLWALRETNRGNVSDKLELTRLGITLGMFQLNETDTDRDFFLVSEINFWETVKNAVITKDHYARGKRSVEERLEYLEAELKAVGSPTIKVSGLSTLFDKKPMSATPSTDEIALIESQREAAYAAFPGQAITSRTWGWEMEIADAKGVDPVFGVDKGEDGSLRSYEANTDCDCDCSDCMYHSCDCDFCESNNDDPDHCDGRECSSADSAEFRTKNGSNRLMHAGLFKITSALEEVEAEVNDTCGVHIHVYAQDLETKQVAQVLAIYKYLENIMAILAGRDNVNYAQRIPIEYVKNAYKGKLPADKPRAINLNHILGNYVDGNRGTIEFRQMAGSYNAKEITFWAWLVRGMVEIAKRGAELKNFLHVKDLNDIIEAYAKFNFLLHDEGAELLIPGGMQDKKHIKLNAHERA
jgi:hypothetical protein